MKTKICLAFFITISVNLLLVGCTDKTESGVNVTDADLFSKENVIVIEINDGKIGEEIAGTLSVEGKVDMCAVDARISYDTAKLKLKALESDNADVIMNEKSEDGAININFMRISNVTEPLNLCGFTFEVITADTTETCVSVDVKEAVRIDGEDITDCAYTAVDGTACLN